MPLVGHPLRSLRRDPLLSGSAVCSLALGLAATTAMFSVVNGLLLTPPAYRHGAELLVFQEVIEEVRHQYPTVPASAAHFMAWRERCRNCGDLAALEPIALTLTGAGEPARIAGARVSANLFRLLGVRTYLGRDFMDDEDAPGRERVVLLSHALWRERFGADPDAIGRSVFVSLEHDSRPAVERPPANRRYVNGEYFAAMGIPILAGRMFDDRDRSGHAVLLSTRTAEALWPGQDPLGRLLHTGDTTAPLAHVVGIAADARTVDVRQADPLMVYEPYRRRHLR